MTPANVIVVLLDSLNRHLVGAYGGREFATPNLDRLAARSLRFDRHFAGSLPCIPARHDLLVGVQDFLWRPWGSIEVWEAPVTWHLRRAGIASKLVTDHPHLFETGGENYHTDFTAWEYLRGGESDPWKTWADPSWIGASSFRWRAFDMPYDASRPHFRSEEDFPGPKTMTAAARWLREEAPRHDRFFLLVDEFDPHEPFDAPEPYASMYDGGWEGPHLVWPPYSTNTVAGGVLTAAEARQIRACYGAKLTMIDAWFGRLLDTIDSRNLWPSTAVFVITDHGHYLGERDLFGKPPVPLYEQLGHIPMLVAWPGQEPRAVDALTTLVDVPATILDVFGLAAEGRFDGRSLRPLIESEADSVRDHVLAGMWSHAVHLIDGHRKYSRSPESLEPLSLWSNRWSTMPIPWSADLRLPPPDERASLDRMPGSSVPVIRQPFREGDMLPYWTLRQTHPHELYDLDQDPGEAENLAGSPLERDYAAWLREELLEIGAPDDQLARLGLT